MKSKDSVKFVRCDVVANKEKSTAHHSSWTVSPKIIQGIAFATNSTKTASLGSQNTVSVTILDRLKLFGRRSSGVSPQKRLSSGVFIVTNLTGRNRVEKLFSSTVKSTTDRERSSVLIVRRD